MGKGCDVDGERMWTGKGCRKMRRVGLERGSLGTYYYLILTGSKQGEQGDTSGLERRQQDIVGLLGSTLSQVKEV
jgi:hypothetical protein